MCYQSVNSVKDSWRCSHPLNLAYDIIETVNMLMRAMLLESPGQPLKLVSIPVPTPAADEVLIKIHACGICRTDLHVVDGELTEPRLPIIPGHQIVGEVVAVGTNVQRWHRGDRVGVPWLGRSCGQCDYCRAHRENLCDHIGLTGYQINGGFAEYCTAHADFCLALPSQYPDLQVAPLLCAGLIGYRSLTLVGEAKRIGIYGFGAAAHIITQVACYQGQEIYAFTKPGDVTAQNFARSLGATWAGSTEQQAPVILDAAIIFAPAGELVPMALAAVRKGGTVVCGGIHMSDIPSFPYSLLWGERILRSVANLTRTDGETFLRLAPKVPVHTEISVYALEAANTALDDLRHGRFSGAAVITTDR